MSDGTAEHLIECSSILWLQHQTTVEPTNDFALITAVPVGETPPSCIPNICLRPCVRIGIHLQRIDVPLACLCGEEMRHGIKSFEGEDIDGGREKDGVDGWIMRRGRAGSYGK